MGVGISLGVTGQGADARLDLEELLSTRLLVQGNSGSGKSHLLRRLLEESAGRVQQAIIDPEGDFVSLAEAYGHLVIDAERTPGDLARIAARVREHRASIVLNLEGLDTEIQMRCAAAFLGGLFDVDRAFWFPMLVVIDEAQLFAPAVGGDVAEDARKASLGAMTNLMCRGRKRGLAGVVATQRLAKLAKNVAAEASNFLMGRTFLDIDMLRAADLLGLERRQAEAFRDLEPGAFVALGPALSRRSVTVRIGAVRTASRAGRPTLMPLPEAPMRNLDDLMAGESTIRPENEPRRVEDVSAVLARIAAVPPPPLPEATEPAEAEAPEREAIFAEIVAGLAADAGNWFKPHATLYQDFLIHCRILRAGSRLLDLAAFVRRFGEHRAGFAGIDPAGPWAPAFAAARALPEDMHGLALALARAAREGAPCPPDTALARIYGSHSCTRVRRVLAHMEEGGAFRIEEDFRGWRVVTMPEAGWRTGPGDPRASDPEGQTDLPPAPTRVHGLHVVNGGRA